MQPVELSHSQTGEHSATVILFLESSLFWFRGHFAHQPLLPGVAQVDWAINYGRALLVPDHFFIGIESVKFQRPLLPGVTVKLQLQWLATHQLLAFQFLLCTKSSESVASQGKIRLCR